jgi:hypothetical protein
MNNNIVGEWRLIDAEMTVKGTTSKTFNPEREMRKIITRTHFFFYSKTENRTPFSAAVTDAERLEGSKTLDAGGGTYDLCDDVYTENVTFCSYPNYEGKSISFKLSFVDDLLIQEGDYPLRELGFADHDGYVKEVYKRMS